MRSLLGVLLVATTAGAAQAQTIGAAQAQQAARPHNVVLFVADGLRPSSVSADVTPNMARMMAQGVRFTNTHSLFPTFTTANASAMATGHGLGDTGDFSNTIYSRGRIAAAKGSYTPFLENDPVLAEMNAQFGGNYLNEVTILAAARSVGFSTAAVGKVGPVHIFDPTESTGLATVNIDDQTGGPSGLPLPAELQEALRAAGLPAAAPSRGANGQAGSSTAPGTAVANVAQQDYFARATTEAVLPLFARRGKPFVLVFWSRDPDGTQHNQGDSPLTLSPGIDGKTSVAAVRNADADLGQITEALARLGLADSTDVILTSDHGFSTISKQSGTSTATRHGYPGVPAGLLPRGFVGIDLAAGLGQRLSDPDDGYKAVDGTAAFTTSGNAAIGDDPENPVAVVAANGGSDLIYVRAGDDATLRRVVEILAGQDYTSGLFVDDDFGPVPGTLPMSAIGLKGSAATPQPSVAISFRTYDLGCGAPTACGVEVADTGLQQGQGMHGSFGRADTANTMAAIGPDFRRAFTDDAPASNADLGMTVAQIAGLHLPHRGALVGRVLTEALAGGAPAGAAERLILSSEPDARGVVTRLEYQRLGSVLYFDAAGYPGRTLGLR